MAWAGMQTTIQWTLKQNFVSENLRIESSRKLNFVSPAVTRENKCKRQLVHGKCARPSETSLNILVFAILHVGNLCNFCRFCRLWTIPQMSYISLYSYCSWAYLSHHITFKINVSCSPNHQITTRFTSNFLSSSTLIGTSPSWDSYNHTAFALSKVFETVLVRNIKFKFYIGL